MIRSKSAREKILVVDDEPINVQMLAEGLSKHYQVLVASVGQEAIRICLAQQPSLVLLDINLPDMSGYEVCKALKSNPETKHVPIIFITGMDSDESELKGLKLGAADFFSKPIKIPVVLARVSIQMELIRKTALLEALVDLDGLTGIPNRRHFDKNFDEEWRRAARRNTSLSMCFIDVDFFKQYNDNYGHAAGDECLKRVAAELDKNIKRAGDSVARFGGEEFVVLLPALTITEAKHFAENLRQRISTLKIPHKYSSCSEFISVSIGVTMVMPHRDKDRESLFEAADGQLYIAKNQGRNCVSCTEI